MDTPPRSRGIVINERRAPSPPQSLRLVKPKTETGTGGSSLVRVKQEPEWSESWDYVKSALKGEETGDPKDFPGLKVVEHQ